MTSLPNHITGTSAPSSLHNVALAFRIHAAQMNVWSAAFLSTSFLSGNDGHQDMAGLLRYRLNGRIIQHTMIRVPCACTDAQPVVLGSLLRKLRTASTICDSQGELGYVCMEPAAALTPLQSIGLQGRGFHEVMSSQYMYRYACSGITVNSWIVG